MRLTQPVSPVWHDRMWQAGARMRRNIASTGSPKSYDDEESSSVT